MRIEEFDSTEDSDLFQYHDSLNPKLWAGETLKPQVLLKLLRIARVFYDFLEVEGLPVEDIVVTGSSANFNYTPHSDVDVHLVVDFSRMPAGGSALAENFFNTKRTLWNRIHTITVCGYPVELYVESTDNPPSAGGTYSLLRQTWISHPKHRKPDLDDAAITAKVEGYRDAIRDAIRDGGDTAADVMERLYDMRRAGLKAGGEFSVENIAFKVLRNMGLVDRLRAAVDRDLDSDLSLAERVATAG